MANNFSDDAIDYTEHPEAIWDREDDNTGVDGVVSDDGETAETIPSDVGSDSPEHMEKINDAFGTLANVIARVKAFDNGTKIRLHQASGIKTGMIEVLLAHPEFIPMLQVNGGTIRREDNSSDNSLTGSSLAYYAPIDNKTSDKLVDFAYKSYVKLLNDACTKYVPNRTGDKAQDEKFSKMSPSEARALTGNDRAMYMEWLRRTKRGEQVNKYPDDVRLMKGNMFAAATDRMRAGIIMSAMHNTKVPAGEYPENSGHAIKNSDIVLDNINRTIEEKYSDSASKIATVTGLSVDEVNKVLDEKGTAFGIPKDSANYEYAASLIPWFYFLVNEYTGNTIADEKVADIQRIHTERGKNTSVDDAGHSVGDTKLYNFGAGAALLKQCGSDANIAKFTKEFMGYLASKIPGITLSGNELSLNGKTVSESEMLSFIFMNIKTSTLASLVGSFIAGKPETERADYEGVVNTLKKIKSALNVSIGRGPKSALIDSSKLGAAIDAQLDLAGMADKSAYASKLAACRAEIKSMKGKSGLRDLAELMGFSAGGDQVKFAANTVFIAKVIDDDELVRGMEDISTYATPNSGDGTSDDAANNAPDSIQTHEFVDAATTAKRYVDAATNKKMSEVRLNSDSDTGKDYREIPIDETGAHLNALVAPSRMIPLFAETLKRMIASEPELQAVYDELIPRLMHYIIAKHHGSVKLRYADAYNGGDNATYLDLAVNDLYDAVKDYFTALSSDSREAIACRSAWIDMAGILDPNVGYPAQILEKAFRNYRPSDDAVDSATIFRDAVGYILSRVLYVKGNSKDITINNPSVVPNGKLTMVNWYNGVNHSDSGKILRKSGTGEGGITRDAIRATETADARVSDEHDGIIEVSFSSDPSTKIASQIEADNYIKPSLVSLNADDGKYYALWNGIVTYSDFSSGAAENTLHTDPRLVDYHEKQLKAYETLHNTQAAEAAENVNERFDEELSAFSSEVAEKINELPASLVDDGMSLSDKYNKLQELRRGVNTRLNDLISASALNSDRDVSAMQKIILTGVNLIDDECRSANRNDGSDTAIAKRRAVNSIRGSLNLYGLFSGELTNKIREAFADIESVAKIVNAIDKATVYKSYGMIKDTVCSDGNAEIAKLVPLSAVPKFIDMVAKAKVKNEYNKIADGAAQVVGDPSLGERVARSTEPVVGIARNGEDSIPQIDEMRNGMLDSVQPGGELSTYAEENGIDSVAVNAENYSSVFADKYPVLGLVKRGKGMSSHGTLRDSESICSAGLNGYDMQVLLGALDSSHAEVSEVRQKYENTKPGIAMSILHGTYLIPSLIDTFYDVFTASGTGMMGKSNGQLSRMSIINQSIDRFKAMANRDSIDPTMYSYVYDCIEALDAIGVRSTDVSAKVTGIANIIIYLESINPMNTVQGVNNGSFNLKSENVPSGAEPFAKSIASTVKNPYSSVTTSVVAKARSAFKSAHASVFGANTRFGEVAAQMYSIFDRGETEGFDNQYDQFRYMLTKLREKSVGVGAPVSGNMANTELMAQLVSAIIDDETNNNGGYTNVSVMLKELSSGDVVPSFYLNLEQPKHDADGELDMSSTRDVKYAKDGSAVPATDNVPGMSTVGDVVTAANGNPKSTDAKISVSDPSTPLVDRTGVVPEAAVTDLVRGVRSAVTENLLKQMSVNNDVDSRIANLFHVGAEDIKAAGKEDFVPLSLILMLLYTRSIDRARYAEVSSAGEEFEERRASGQVANVSRRIAEIDPALGTAAKAGGFGDNNQVIKDLVSAMSEYGVAKLTGADTAPNVNNEQVRGILGDRAASFMDGFGNYLTKSHASIREGEDASAKVKMFAEKYLAKVLRSDSDISERVNNDDNVDQMRKLSVLLAAYRKNVEPSVIELSELKDDDNSKAARIRRAVRSFMTTPELGDMTIEGYLKNTKNVSDDNKLYNLATKYVGQLVATDPIFRSHVLKKETDRDTVVKMQGVTPLDDTAKTVSSERAKVLFSILSKPASDRTDADMSRANDLGIADGSISMFDDVCASIDRIIDELADAATQYYKGKKFIERNPEATGGKADDARNKITTYDPNVGDSTTSRYMTTLRGILDNIGGVGSSSWNAGISRDSEQFTVLSHLLGGMANVVFLNEIDLPTDKTPSEIRAIRRDSVASLKEYTRKIVANTYANGKTMYRRDATHKLATLSRNSTLTAQMLSPDDCINVLKGLGKVDQSISVHVTVPGSSEDMYSIYGTPRNRDEAAAIVNAAIYDLAKSDGLSDSDTKKLIDGRVSDDATRELLAKLSTFVKAHAGMTSGAEVTPETVAPYVMTMLVRSHCLKKTADGYTRTIQSNGGMVTYTIPVSFIVELVENRISVLDFDSNTWMALVNEYEKYTKSGARERYTGHGNAPINRLVRVADMIKESIDNSCRQVGEALAASGENEIVGSHGIKAVKADGETADSNGVTV